MSAVKQAAYAAKKAARAARIAYLYYLRAKIKELKSEVVSSRSGSPARHHEVMAESGQEEGLLTPPEMGQGRGGEGYQCHSDTSRGSKGAFCTVTRNYNTDTHRCTIVQRYTCSHSLFIEPLSTINTAR